MSYQVLARKWRPHNFNEMVGQEHVLRALINALDQQRLHHAYLFAGTRGVGKTTIARILAKSLNCEKGISSTPCGECSACVEIDQGRFIDLIEVDAASRTKVEDTRELLDNVQYSPTRGRYKVYLIDEVHMLSTHSFNALLKTLEEPPPHVKFLLATTDPQKLPATILSRCLQFKLKRMPLDQIVEHLSYILAQETISAETPALKHLARAADGSMRDALSLLDQAIAFGQGSVNTKEVQSMLGDVGLENLNELLEALAAKDPNQMIRCIEHLEMISPDFESVLNDLMVQIHQLILAQMAAEAVDDSMQNREDVINLSSKFSLEDLQLYYQVGLIGKRDLQLAPSMRSGFEMVLLRMLAFSPARVGGGNSSTPDPNMKQAPVRVPEAALTEPANTHLSNDVAQRQQPAPAAVPQPATPPSDNDWKGIVGALQLKGMVSELAANCALQRREDNAIFLTLPGAHKQLYSPAFEERLCKALSEYYKTSIKLSIEVGGTIESETPAMQDARLAEEKQQSAVDYIEQDTVVQALKDKLGAQVQTNAVRPVE